LLRAETLFAGGIDGCQVSTRIIVQRALELNAAAVIVSHNHPSGDPSPSDADKHLTKQIKSALALVDVSLLDHIIVGGVKHFSFELQGLL
jgi:DNA repair protein RadC